MRAADAGKWAAAAAAVLAWRSFRQGRWQPQGRVALVTGGTRGLGLVLTRQLLAQGVRVAICGRDPESLERAYRQLSRSAPGRVFAATCDVGDAAQVQALVRQVVARFGRLDIVVNNAGLIQMGPVEEMTLEDFDAGMRVHFWGPLHTTQAALPHLKAARGGRILNISSIGGKLPVPHLLPYSASKFALTGLSEGLRVELARHRIAVTTVCPGLMRTGSPRQAAFKGRHRAEYAWFKITGSLPGSSMNVERAARRILLALRRGEPELVLSLPAKAAALFHGVFPGTTIRLMSAANRLLPRPGGIGTRNAAGWQSQSRLSESWVTSLTDRAAVHNNEA